MLTFLIIFFLFSKPIIALEKLNYLIEERRSYEALELLEHSLIAKEVSFLQIFLAMKQLFNIESTEYILNSRQKEFPLFFEQPENFKIVKTLLLWCAKDEENDFRNQALILGVLDVFVEKTELARILQFLFAKKKLDEVSIRKLLNYHEYLFLQDLEINEDELNNIVINLIPVKDCKNVLKIILKHYINLHKKPLSISEKFTLFKGNNLCDEISLAIFENDKNLFRRLHFRDILNGAIPRKNTLKYPFEKIVERSTSITNFVIFQILYSKDKQNRLFVYKFWKSVMKRLWKLKDAFSAFAIGTALSRWEIQKLLNKTESSKIFKLLKPSDNYKNYRIFCEKCDYKIIPGVPVLVRDIMLIWEAKSFDKDNINLEPIKFLNKLRKEFNKMFEFINEENFPMEETSLLKFFKNLPDISDALSTALICYFENSKDNSLMELPIKLSSWDFSHIKQWIRMPLCINSYDKFLYYLIFNFHIFSGEDLIIMFYANIDDYKIFFSDSKNDNDISESITNLKILLDSLKNYFELEDSLNSVMATYLIKSKIEAIKYLSSFSF